MAFLVVCSVFHLEVILLFIFVNIIFLCENNGMQFLSKDWEFDSISNKVRSLGDFQELGIFVAITELPDEAPFNFVLALSSLIVRIFLWSEVFGGVGRAGRQRVFVDQQVRSWSLLAAATGSHSSLHGFLIGLDLSHGLHKVDALCQEVCLLARFCYVGEVLVKLLEVGRQVHVLGLFG